MGGVLRVFVSSTWLDLQVERQAVEGALQRLRETKTVGMEYFGSRPENTHTASVDEVARSDIFVCLVATRYGSGITQAEYRKARDLELPCFIYFRAESAAPPPGTAPEPLDAANRLAAFKQELGRAHTVTEFENADRLAALLTADLHRFVMDRLTTSKAQAYAVTPAPSPPLDDDRQGLAVLLQRVQQFWISGVLMRSLVGETLIELGKESRIELVEHPWERVLQVHGADERTVSSEHRILDLFEKHDRSLLILGEPGSGKTTTLLELARELIERCGPAVQMSVPVVFSLSERRIADQPVGDWLVGELQSKYRIPRQIGGRWIEEHRITVLLDGLDELPEEERVRTVGAINRFAEEVGVPGIAVCSRTAEYVALRERLKLMAAVSLRPLSREQVETFLRSGGIGLDGLRIALHMDDALLALAQSPLTLSIMCLAYQGASPALSGSPRSPDSTRRQIFDAYIERMFSRRGRAQAPYSVMRMMSWLCWLARRMREQSMVVLSIDEIQPTLLDSSRARLVYLVASRFAVAAAFALPYAWIARMGHWREIFALIVAATLTAIVCDARAVVYQARASTGRLPNWVRAVTWIGIYALLQPICVLAAAESLDDGSLHHQLGWFLEFGPAFFAIFVLRPMSNVAERDIPTGLWYGWQWRRAVRGALLGFVIVFIAAWGQCSLIDLGTEKPVEFGVRLGVVFGLVGGFLFGGLAPRVREEFIRPNAGIVQALKLACIAGVCAVLCGGPWLLLTSGGALFYLLGVTVPIAVLWFGGAMLLQHYTLRAILALSGRQPARMQKFLEYAMRLVFLRRVGGGYIFVHRTLLEHFAMLAPSAGRTPSSPTRDVGQPATTAATD